MDFKEQLLKARVENRLKVMDVELLSEHIGQCIKNRIIDDARNMSDTQSRTVKKMEYTIWITFDRCAAFIEKECIKDKTGFFTGNRIVVERCMLTRYAIDLNRKIAEKLKENGIKVGGWVAFDSRNIYGSDYDWELVPYPYKENYNMLLTYGESQVFNIDLYKPHYEYYKSVPGKSSILRLEQEGRTISNYNDFRMGMKVSFCI